MVMKSVVSKCPASLGAINPELHLAPEKGPWFVVYTQPKREQVATVNLQQQGFDAYLPLFKTFKKSPTGMLSAFAPMFPRYVFFRPAQAGLSLSGARSTRGVSFLLSFGNVPATLKTAQLHIIQRCESERNQVDFVAVSPFQPGRLVRLRQPGLNGLEGLVTAVTSKRVSLLIDLLSRQTNVEVGHDQLELA